MRIACESVADNELCPLNALVSALTAGRRMTSHVDMLRRSNKTCCLLQDGVFQVKRTSNGTSITLAISSISMQELVNFQQTSSTFNGSNFLLSTFYIRLLKV
jgi:hypothetical protein